MSLKKDSFSSFDKKNMRFAINLAKNQNGLTGTNPSVGCVIVKNKKIISYGVTNLNGRPHAETIELNACKKNSSKSLMYITLEPCSHFGKTPPCCNLIIKHKIPHVVIGTKDPYHKVLGNGIQKMKEAGIKVYGFFLVGLPWEKQTHLNETEKHIFEINSDFLPTGDQPQAIDDLVKGSKTEMNQTLLGVTGSGKTFTVANVIANTGKNALIISHNKTLACLLYTSDAADE